MADTVFQLTQEHNPAEVRRNFRLLSADGICYITALAFLDQSTVLPAFLSSLTTSSILIGAIIAVRPAGLFLPQLWSAHYLRGRTLHMGYLIKVAAVARIVIALFAGLLFAVGPGDRTLMLWSFIAMYVAFWLSEGAAGVSVMDITAKAIPERLRGRLFGVMSFTGGVLAIAAGAVVGRMLSREGPSYPTNYAVLCALAAVFLAVSLLSLSRVRETEGAVEVVEGDFLGYVRSIGRMLAGHGQLKRLLIVQLLFSVQSIAVPFYILYAYQLGRLSGSTIGLFLAIQAVGNTLSSAVSGYISDHRGPKSVIIATLVFAASAPVFALTVGRLSIWLYGLVFLAVGAVMGSAWIGFTNFLLELAEPAERRSYIGLMNSANAPSMFFPLLGGLIAQVASYRVVFVVTAVALSLALVFAFGLVTRKRSV